MSKPYTAEDIRLFDLVLAAAAKVGQSDLLQSDPRLGVLVTLETLIEERDKALERAAYAEAMIANEPSLLMRRALLRCEVAEAGAEPLQGRVEEAVIDVFVATESECLPKDLREARQKIEQQLFEFATTVRKRLLVEPPPLLKKEE